MANAQVFQFPDAAAQHIREIQQQINAAQGKLQAFVDGVVIGMGVDISSGVEVNLQEMSISIPEKVEAIKC
jgi:hypothetical protein